MEPETLSRTLTLRQAADETNLSQKALTGRVERGSLPHVKHNGVRRIPRSALIEAGLLGVDGTTPEGEPPRQGTPEPAAVVGELAGSAGAPGRAARTHGRRARSAEGDYGARRELR